jgi:hypothetical protein
MSNTVNANNDPISKNSAVNRINSTKFGDNDPPQAMPTKNIGNPAPSPKKTGLSKGANIFAM